MAGCVKDAGLLLAGGHPAAFASQCFCCLMWAAHGALTAGMMDFLAFCTEAKAHLGPQAAGCQAWMLSQTLLAAAVRIHLEAGLARPGCAGLAPCWR